MMNKSKNSVGPTSDYSSEPSFPRKVMSKIQNAKTKGLKELNLSNWRKSETQKLTSLPSEIFELEQLEVLDLSGNLLTALPEAITNLKNLTALYLSRNYLTTLPEAIIHLPNLTTLSLNSNQFEIFPEVITYLSLPLAVP